MTYYSINVIDYYFLAALTSEIKKTCLMFTLAHASSPLPNLEVNHLQPSLPYIRFSTSFYLQFIDYF